MTIPVGYPSWLLLLLLALLLLPIGPFLRVSTAKRSRTVSTVEQSAVCPLARANGVLREPFDGMSDTALPPGQVWQLGLASRLSDSTCPPQTVHGKTCLGELARVDRRQPPFEECCSSCIPSKRFNWMAPKDVTAAVERVGNDWAPWNRTVPTSR